MNLIVTISPDHPIQSFSFEILNENGVEWQSPLTELILRLSKSREWVIGPPALFADESDGQEEPVKGGYLDIYSALGSQKLPQDIDQKHLEEVTTFIRALQEFSRQHQLVIDCHLDDTFVGSIQEGMTDDLIETTLLGEWQRHLQGQ